MKVRPIELPNPVLRYNYTKKGMFFIPHIVIMNCSGITINFILYFDMS